MTEEFTDSKKAEDFLVREQQKVEEISGSDRQAEKKLEKKINEEKKEVASIEKERKKLAKAEKKIKQEIKKDEELAFDFGKAKKFFRPKKKAEKASGEEQLGINIASVAGFAWNYRAVLLILIAIFFAVFIRVQTIDLPYTDKWAESTVDNHYKTQIKAQIDKQYPNLPEQNKLAILEQEFANYKDANKETFEQQEKELSQQFKGFYRFDSNNRNYMPDIDPYVYLLYAENYLEHGYIGDEKRTVNGTEVQWDNHQTAPLGGRITAKTLHPYMLAYLYKFIKIFDPGTTPMDSASYFPVIFAALSVIPAFFIGRKIAGNVGGFFSAFIIAIHPAFMGRTLWGHADTDAYNVFFPLYIVWMFLVAIDQKDRARQVSYAALAGLFTGIYALAWNGWWYVFDFIIGMTVIYLLYLLLENQWKNGFRKLVYGVTGTIIFLVLFLLSVLYLGTALMVFFGILLVLSLIYGFYQMFANTKKIWKLNIQTIKERKRLIITFIAFLAASAIFVSLFSAEGFSTFVSSPIQPIAFSKLKVAAHETLWPNVYTTVAELNPASLSQILSSVGGSLLFFISLFGIALMFIRKQGRMQSFHIAILVILWYIGIFYASTKGVRFTMMLVPPFALAFGAALGLIYDKITSYAKSGMAMSAKITGPVLVVIFFLLLIAPYNLSMNTARNDVAIINDAWFNALNRIRIESSPDAIVNSWWDFGHHFKYYTDRSVTFDGGSQNSPMAHWIGKVLLTDDEKLAVGILRMLDCGSNTAFDRLNAKINDVSASVNMLYEIVKLDKSEAAGYLSKKGLSESEAEEVLSYTHCNPPEDYFITSEDMVGKSGVWAHFGSWDFDRADIWVFAKDMPQQKAIDFIMQNSNISREDAERTYFDVQGIADEGEANTWIAPWPSYVGISNCVNIQNETIQCSNGITINLTSKDVRVPTQQGTLPPDSFIYKTTKGIAEKTFDSGLGFSVALLGTENPQVVLMQTPLAKSMFTRLFYFEGYGLGHFDLFDHQRGLTGTEIYVWKVDWDGSN